MLGLGGNISRRRRSLGGAAAFTPSGYSLAFDGTDDWVSFGDTNHFDGTPDISIQMWLKFDDATGFSYPAMKIHDQSGNTKGLRIRFLNNDKIGFLLKGGYEDDPAVDTTVFTRTSTAALTSNEGSWVHVVFTGARNNPTNDTQSQTKIYINGSLDGTSNSSSDDTITTNNNGELVLGGYRTGAAVAGEFTGRMSEFAIWNTVLDADAVAALYNSGNALNAAVDSGDYDNSGNLTGYWRLDESTGTTVTDITSGGQNGTINNATWVQDAPWP